MNRSSLRACCFMLLVLIGCAQMEKSSMKSYAVLPPGQHDQAFETTITKTLSCKYLLFLPDGYGEKTQRWPMILFLPSPP